MFGFLLACAPTEPPLLNVVAPAEWVGVVADHVASLPHAVSVTEGTPEVPAAVEVVLELSNEECAECFMVLQEGNRFTVAAGGIAGALYGLAQLMEWHGWRFAHPFDTCVPLQPTLASDAQIGVSFAPEMSRRGYHPHTLHPTEAMFDLWGDPDPARAKAMLDWVVRNRGNYIQWPGLDNIVTDSMARDLWMSATATVLAAAHDRGITVGLAVQLFGQSNLQQAFDLLDSSGTVTEDAAAMAARWEVAIGNLPWDEVSLSFGEFFAADPETFIGRVALAYDTLQEAAPGTAMNAVIHVGGNEDVQVEYAGHTMTYYFLVQFVDRPIEPFVHTVMYYNLFEDAGGAYGLDNFDEHRTFLEGKLAAGEQVTYFPESAYWVAFDDSVPTYLPLYIRSRWLDMNRLQESGLPLDRHVVFASGWEWGYWQNDAATLRMGYSTPAGWEDAVRDLFVDDAIADAIITSVNAQVSLIDQRLAPYLAGRDVAMDLGDRTGIYSQPRRVLFNEVAELDAAAQAALRLQVVAGLRTFADAHDAANIGLTDDRWALEVSDGLSVNAARARFMAALYEAVLAAAEGGDSASALAEADLQFEAGKTVIARRHAALHDPVSERLIVDGGNPTLYDYGYLTNAETLCFWRRELGEARELLLGESWSDPGCTL